MGKQHPPANSKLRASGGILYFKGLAARLQGLPRQKPPQQAGFADPAGRTPAKPI